jgi:hypothetical protein
VRVWSAPARIVSAAAHHHPGAVVEVARRRVGRVQLVGVGEVPVGRRQVAPIEGCQALLHEGRDQGGRALVHQHGVLAALPQDRLQVLPADHGLRTRGRARRGHRRRLHGGGLLLWRLLLLLRGRRRDGRRRRLDRRLRLRRRGRLVRRPDRAGGARHRHRRWLGPGRRLALADAREVLAQRLQPGLVSRRRLRPAVLRVAVRGHRRRPGLAVAPRHAATGDQEQDQCTTCAT